MTLFGFLMYLWASSLIASGSVAENSIVCLCFGTLWSIHSMSSMNPMSSIRSASSSTTTETPSKLSSPRRMRSMSLPGVPMTISTPFLILVTWTLMDWPP